MRIADLCRKSVIRHTQHRGHVAAGGGPRTNRLFKFAAQITNRIYSLTITFRLYGESSVVPVVERVAGLPDQLHHRSFVCQHLAAKPKS